MTETEFSLPRYDRLPAKVFGCLRTGEITIILLPGYGMVDGGLLEILPICFIPFDLRMPNSEFDVICDRLSGQFIKVLRKGETYPEPN